MSYRIAVIGATGSVGREILSVLAEREFPVETIYALASQSSKGQQVSFGEDKVLTVQTLDHFDFSQVDLVLSSVGATVIQQHVDRITSAGAVLVDNSSAFRKDPEVPLVVPEVNAEALHFVRHKNIVASPNCIAIPLALALGPLAQLAGISRVVVSTYQATSGAGYGAMDELFRQTRAIFVNDALEKTHFTKQIAFNAIPHIGEFESDGYTDEESKISTETQKILGQDIAITATAVRVPVFVGHALSVNIAFDSELSATQARQALKSAPGLSVIDHRQDEGYVTPVECAGEDNVFISRIRQDETIPYGLNLWMVGDNLRKGAALNTVQIAESLAAQHLIG